ncbi:hypothetical protein L3Y34_013836 [Caenorhabditis briggsae]|uniref:Uncharacterized protein n=1 Tax=Caenorhabditis briggsae TaxID=6238 RepID=A0AAE9CY12_CAEBR|nr:hypothetical protein L3Y34_013836 [Caenorhabditis briggsae]
MDKSFQHCCAPSPFCHPSLRQQPPTIKFPTDPNPVAFDSKVSTDFKIHEKFFISAKMDNWEVVFMRNEEVRDFTESIIQAMGQYGMAGQPPSHLH